MPLNVTYTAPAGQSSVTFGNGLPAAPTAEFIGTPTSGTTPLAVTFTNQSVGAIDSFLWDFGDGTTSTATNPTKAYLTAASFTVALTAIGPGGSNTRTRTSYVVASAPSPGPTPPPPPPPPPPSLAAGEPQFTLLSSSSGTLPFAVGFACRAGHFAGGVSVSGATAQVAVRNTWPDGSAKFVQVAGTYTSTGGVPFTVTLASGTPPGGAPLSIAALKATGVTAGIAFGAFGSATWAGTDWDTPFQTLTTDSQMSSWVYRKQIGTDAHLVAWLEVRAYAGGAVEVLPWIENGYLSVASPTLKAARATFTLGGTLRYDSISDAGTPGAYDVAQTVDGSGVLSMPHHTRAVLIRAGATSHWLGTDPGVVPLHDRAYLTSTKMVPAYAPTSINETSLVALTPTYNPGRLAYTSGSMGATGFDSDIGLLPNTSALYLVSGDVRAYKAVIAAGFSLANYCIHYRDQATNRPLLFASHPNKSLATDNGIPAPSGGRACLYASSHHPAAAYLPYLLTGWNWFLEEQQFQVTTHYLARNEAFRKNANYYFNMSAFGEGLNEQSGLRAQGWQLRACAMAASMTPDADTTMRAQFVTVLGYNAGQFRQQHESGNADNPFGANTLGAAGKDWDIAVDGWGVWQDAFFTASLGLAWDLDVVSDTTARANMLWLRDFKYKIYSGLLGRSGVPSEYGFTRAANYAGTMLGTGASVGGGTFNWFTSMGDVWTETWGSPNTDATANTLVGGNIESGTDGLSTSYWGNIQPAIAYAVDHAAPGALTSYYRMVNATNWASKVTQFSAVPVWGIKPRTVTGTVPAPGFALAIETVGAPGSDTGFQSVRPSPFTYAEFGRTLCGSFGSGVFCENYSAKGAYISAATGGHAHPDMVDAVGFDFTTRTWFHLANANGAANIGTGGYRSDTTSTADPWFEAVAGSPATVPAPPHPYSCAVYIPPANGGGTKGSFAYGIRHAATLGAASSVTAHGMNLDSRLWSRLVSAGGLGSIGDIGGSEGRCVFDPVTSRIYLIGRNYHIYNYVPFVNVASVTTYGTTGTFTAPPDYGSDGCGNVPGAVLDPTRRLIVRTLQRKLRALDLNNIGAGWQLLTMTNASLLPDVPLGESELCYHPVNDAFYYMPGTGGATLYKIKPPPVNSFSEPWVVTTQTIGGDTIHPHGNDGLTSSGSGAHKSLMYVAADNMLAWCAFGQHGSGGTAVRPMTYINPTN